MAADEVKFFFELLVAETIIAAKTDVEADHVGVVVAGAEAGEAVEPGSRMAQADAVYFPYEGFAGAGIGDEVLFVLHVWTKLRNLGGWLHAGGDAEAVPGIDDDDTHDDLAQVLFVEEGGCLVVGGVGDVVMADEGDLFGKGEDAAFFRGEEGRLLPGIKRVDALFGLAGFAGVPGMHIDAKGAAVDLGGPDLDEVFVGLGEAGGAEVLFHGDDRAVACGFGLIEFDPCGHSCMFLTIQS